VKGKAAGAWSAFLASELSGIRTAPELLSFFDWQPWGMGAISRSLGQRDTGQTDV